LVSGDSAFALDLFHEIAEGDANVFFSPHSISSALAMSYAGARGETETQMADALHFELRQETLHVAFDWLDLELNGRGEVSPPYEGEGFDLHVVNAVWGQRGHPFRSSYLDTLAVNYGAGLRLLDFSGDPDGSRITINEWVSGQTNERIQDLLPSGSISEVTRLVLTNAIYFNAPWLYPFDEKETKARSFLPVSGPSFSVPMMYQRGTFSYARVGNVQVVELPYNGGKLAMLLLVPDGGQLAAFEDALDLAGYEAIVTALEARQVDLWLPRFEFTYDVSLLHPLTALGMADAFTPDVADFSGIDGSRGLFVADVLHKAFVSVDEAGTEAAAATAVVIGGTGAPATPVTLVIDRPFLFVIRDIPTDAILFVGRVMEP
jgi:serpin B